jgi:hypothetical protein
MTLPELLKFGAFGARAVTQSGLTTLQLRLFGSQYGLKALSLHLLDLQCRLKSLALGLFAEGTVIKRHQLIAPRKRVSTVAKALLQDRVWDLCLVQLMLLIALPRCY